MENPAWVFIILLAVVMIIIWLFLFADHNQLFSDEKIDKKRIYGTKENGQIAFYDKCMEQNIHDLKTWSNFQSALQIAFDLDLINSSSRIDKVTEDALKAYYEEAKIVYTNNIAVIRKKKLEEQKQQEREEEQRLTKYADHHGTHKRIAMLSDEEAYFRNQADLLFAYSVDLIQGSQKKELDENVVGAIVSVLDGPEAGATAVTNTILQNSQIREENAKSLKLVSERAANAQEDSRCLRMEAERIHRDVYEAEYKAVKELSDEDATALLSFENSSIKIHETGSFTVSVTLKYKNPLEPIDGKKMVIDGTVAAELYQEDRLIGTALLVLPAYGLVDERALRTICCANADPGKAYKIKFVPYNVWLIEA